MTLTLRGTLQGKKKKKKISHLHLHLFICKLSMYIFKEGRSMGEANSSLYLD